MNDQRHHDNGSGLSGLDEKYESALDMICNRCREHDHDDRGDDINERDDKQGGEHFIGYNPRG